MNRHRLLFGLCLILLVLAATPPPTAAADCQDWVARTVSVQGRVETRRAGESQWLPVQIGAAHCLGDAVRLGTLSRAAIVLREGGVVRLDQNTTITFTPPPERAGTWLDVLTGSAHFFTRAPRRLRVTTPFVNGTVGGTEFLVEVEVAEARISVWEGRVVAENALGSVELISGQAASARAGQPPTPRAISIRPADAAAWTIYYPPVLDLRPDDFPDRPGETWPGDVRRSITAAQAGDLETAFSSLARVPDPAPDPRIAAYRASLLLSVGRVAEAKPAIERILARDPGNASALALSSVMAVVDNDRAQALRLANDAVLRDPSSVSARVAESYARQASGDLDVTRQSIEEAVRLDPASALARARLAELLLAQGRVDEALAEAQEAVRLGPSLGRTHTVLGFVHLARLEVAAAVETFEAAIARDPASPLPRLGLGLARIRRGYLEAGRQELEIAVGLDPGDSLLRSYLGKAYYEEREPVLAAEQFKLARELDPNDPTPWLYDAIRLQSVNRPVEALDALERSIELNDNRAVYRSRLLLDEDRATRGADLARIYDDLGFRQLALVQGTKSLNVDPANYSAHRFLADVYGFLPRHEIARVSEVLQSQLLQPINVNPVPPLLSLSNSFILAGTGPSTAELNEFNALFERNRAAVRLSGVVGGNGTYGDELVVSGLYDNIAVSIGQFHYQTDGFRTNNDLKQDIFNAFAQVELTTRTSIQGEIRTTRTRKGDLDLRFDQDNFLAGFRQEDDIQSLRFGLRHAFTPDSILLASAIFQNADFAVSTDPESVSNFEENGYTLEAQHLFRTARFSLVSGVGYTDANTRDQASQANPEPISSGTTQTNFYEYATIRLPYGLVTTLGVSVNLFDGVVSTDQVNPKFGLTWTPLPPLTLRGAAFRTLERSLTSSQTVEPTQLAGFNQFFRDGEGTDAWRYGVGVDYKITSRLYTGAEASWRDLEVPGEIFLGEPTVVRGNWKEQLARAYLYWAPVDWLSLGVEYLFEKFERDIDFANGGEKTDIRTHRVPLSIGFYHPSGFTARFLATYFDQSGTFGVPAEQKADNFWVLDASISYRLPRRWGLITLEGRNLLNERFHFQDTDVNNPTLIPERLILLKFTLAY